MSEFPENLYTIKTEEAAKQTRIIAEKTASEEIKERLNLHVKRRLQQEMPIHASAPGSERKAKAKEVQKVRRPYQKRADKTQTPKQTTTEPGCENSANRKYKRQKLKVSGAGAEDGGAEKKIGAGTENAADRSRERLGCATGEDDGSIDEGQEMEMKMANIRDKDKSPDILRMVLSAKKLALMQNPEVQQFMRQVMSAIKQ